MDHFVRILLALYPGAYREQFALEMLEVFRESASALPTRAPFARFRFYSRELHALLLGAFREHLAVALGPELSAIFFSRRFLMRSTNRFPMVALIFMLLSFVAVVYAIAQAAALSQALPHQNPVLNLSVVRVTLPGGILVLFAIAYLVGMLGWAVAFALHRSGAERLERMETWSAAK